MLDIEAADASGRRLRLRGELDLLTATDLMHRLEPLCGSSGDIVLECDELTFVDSQGIRTFLQAARALADGSFVIARPSREVRKLFDIVRIQDFPNIVVRD